MQNQTDIIAATHLGKKSIGSESYNPALLVVVPREENRQQYKILNDELPFNGYDIWHAYEFSTLTQNSIPVTRVIKLKYNCNNDYLIESKSLKLYLNSFNMSKFGKNIHDCLKICKNIIQSDLSSKLKTSVELEFLKEDSNNTKIFKDYKNIFEYINEENLIIDKFKESPELLEYTTTNNQKEYRLFFDSLRSNCRVTHQPDFGDVFIYYKSDKHFHEESLIKYLTSFRSEYHFHEECCEMIFKRLFDILDQNDELFVCALYTRRGGIDICPARWSKNIEPQEVLPLLELNTFARKSIKQ